MNGQVFVLVSVSDDSLGIHHEIFNDKDSAKFEMEREYEECEPDSSELSVDYINDNSALINHGFYVRIWKIIEVNV